MFMRQLDEIAKCSQTTRIGEDTLVSCKTFLLYDGSEALLVLGMSSA
jgi:hypothetical protein